MQTTLFVISSLKDGLVMGDDKRAKAVETPKEPEKLTAHHHVEDHQPKEPKNPTADLPQEEAHAAKGNSELKAADVAANFQAKWLKDLKGDLTEEAKSESNQDLRRAQLTARANEKERVEEERGERKEQKKNAKKDPKPKGRPRRVEGDEPPKKRKSNKSKGGEDAVEATETSSPAAGPPAKKKKKTEALADKGAALPKAKAKPKACAKRAPMTRGGKPPPPSDKAMEKEIFDLLRRYKDVPYNKDTDVLHKIYTKKNSNPYCCIYWNRPAGGVKIHCPDGAEMQKFYFSYAYSSVAVHIYCCNQIIKKFQGAPEGWWDSSEAMDLFQLLLVTAGSAQKSFNAMDVD